MRMQRLASLIEETSPILPPTVERRCDRQLVLLLRLSVDHMLAAFNTMDTKYWCRRRAPPSSASSARSSGCWRPLGENILEDNLELRLLRRCCIKLEETMESP